MKLPDTSRVDSVYRPPELLSHAAAFQTIPPTALDPRITSVPSSSSSSSELVTKAALNAKPIGLVESKDDDSTYNYFTADAQETAI